MPHGWWYRLADMVASALLPFCDAHTLNQLARCNRRLLRLLRQCFHTRRGVRLQVWRGCFGEGNENPHTYKCAAETGAQLCVNNPYYQPPCTPHGAAVYRHSVFHTTTRAALENWQHLLGMRLPSDVRCLTRDTWRMGMVYRIQVLVNCRHLSCYQLNCTIGCAMCRVLLVHWLRRTLPHAAASHQPDPPPPPPHVYPMLTRSTHRADLAAFLWQRHTTLWYMLCTHQPSAAEFLSAPDSVDASRFASDSDSDSERSHGMFIVAAASVAEIPK